MSQQLEEWSQIISDDYDEETNEWTHTGCQGFHRGRVLIGLQEFIRWSSKDGCELELVKVLSKHYHLRIR